VIVNMSTVSVTTILVHAEDWISSNETVAGQIASRTQPVHNVGVGAIAFVVIEDV
jgi:hypothetical protein